MHGVFTTGNKLSGLIRVVSACTIRMVEHVFDAYLANVTLNRVCKELFLGAGGGGGCGCVVVCCILFFTHILQLKVVNLTLNSQKYQDDILEPIVKPFLNSPEGQNIVLQDDNTVLASSKNTNLSKTLLVFDCPACHQT